jgi:hypothetical protein
MEWVLAHEKEGNKSLYYEHYIQLLGMQATGMAPKAPSTTPHFNLNPNLTDGTFDIINHDELRIY